MRQRFLLPEANMPEILVSGCSDSEYSYDAEIDGRYNGAMTALAIRVIRQNPRVTYNDFYTSLRGYLPSSDYPQTPQLEGSDAHKNTLLFEPFTHVPEPSPTPTPEPGQSPGCVPSFILRIVQFFKSE